MDTLLSFLNQPKNVLRAVRFNLQLGGESLDLTERFLGMHITAMYGFRYRLLDIHVAAIYGLRYATQRLLDEGTLADSCDSQGQTPLFLAAMTGEVGVVTLLVARDDVNVNAQNHSPYSLTPLIVAVEGSHHQVMRVLLQGGADVNLRSLHGTALNCAIRSLSMISIRLLLEAGADPDVLDDNGVPIIFQAMRLWFDFDKSGPEISLVELFHKRGANLKAKDKSQRTLLHLAAEACDHEAVQVLLAEGLDPGVIDDMDRTPFQIALHFQILPLDWKVRGQLQYSISRERIVHLLGKM